VHNARRSRVGMPLDNDGRPRARWTPEHTAGLRRRPVRSGDQWPGHTTSQGVAHARACCSLASRRWPAPIVGMRLHCPILVDGEGVGTTGIDRNAPQSRATDEDLRAELGACSTDMANIVRSRPSTPRACHEPGFRRTVTESRGEYGRPFSAIALVAFGKVFKSLWGRHATRTREERVERIRISWHAHCNARAGIRGD
jgi:hypothetical protein